MRAPPPAASTCPEPIQLYERTNSYDHARGIALGGLIDQRHNILDRPQQQRTRMAIVDDYAAIAAELRRFGAERRP
jgi:hypothetical protein